MLFSKEMKKAKPVLDPLYISFSQVVFSINCIIEFAKNDLENL